MRLFNHMMVAGILFSFTAQMGHAKTELGQKIVGGVEASIGEFPFIVSLHSSSFNGHFCGGSLIKKNWVLTAAHCARGAKISKVVIGLHNQKDQKNAEVIKPARVIVHPNYNNNTLDYDYALVQLEKDSSYEPVELNKVELNAEQNLMATTAGWGATKENSYTLPDKLQKVDVPLVSADACAKSYPGETTDRMICAGYNEGGKDSCQGDSGGPLVLKDSDNRTFLIGVVSWGQGCARPGYYGVYSKVSANYDWIMSNIQ